MESQLQSLPEAVVQMILPYTYTPQSKELCSDIRSYQTTLVHLTQLYQEKYQADIEAREWLSNDICRFLNQGVPTSVRGYQDFYLGVFQRMYMNQPKSLEAIREYITRIDYDLYPRDIKIVIGLLQPQERHELVRFSHDIQAVSPG